MEIQGSTLRLDDTDWANSELTEVRLPSGSASGGILITRAGGQVFVLFSDENLQPGETLRASPSRGLEITSAAKAYLRDRRVTVLEVRPVDPFERGAG